MEFQECYHYFYSKPWIRFSLYFVPVHSAVGIVGMAGLWTVVDVYYSFRVLIAAWLDASQKPKRRSIEQVCQKV